MILHFTFYSLISTLRRAHRAITLSSPPRNLIEDINNLLAENILPLYGVNITEDKLHAE